MGSGAAEAVFDADCDDEDFRVDPEIPEIVVRRNIATAITLDKKREVIEHWLAVKKKKYRSMRAMANRYRFINDDSDDRKMLYRWQTQVEQGGTYREKLTRISEEVHQRFVSYVFHIVS